ncbi:MULTISPECIES: TetR/AcrR family transcriptional regulator [unclassified Sphingomonas]|uniref:TetR/AcrR family transcriptional regulator n=1 Tax=unclassified Sphingomonas TaxID=196159 RepID=UPI000A9F1CCA|nr:MULTISPECIES: TetR/AcrR family transcriptional regulator [unclassified Sphingomonas]
MTRRQEIGAERRERTRQRLLAASARVVAELGEKKASIDDFIRAAGVARGTFYNHYSTREQLIDDLWASIGQAPFHQIQKACESLDDPAARLATEARLVFASATQNEAWGWLVYSMSADNDTVSEDLLSYPRPDLEIGRKQGRFQFDDLSAACDLVVGSVRWGLRAVLEEGRPLRCGDSLCVLLLKALSIGDAEAREIVARPLPELPVLSPATDPA